MKRWCLKNKLLANVIFSSVMCGFFSICLFILGGRWIILVVDLLLIIVNKFYIDSFSIGIANEAVTIRNNTCDPYPLLNETAELLKIEKNEANKLVHIINQSTAYSDLGEYAKQEEILRSYNIDKPVGIPPYHKVLYYNNLADAYFYLGEYAKAEVYSEMAMRLAREINTKNKLINDQLNVLMMWSRIRLAKIKDDHKTVLELLDAVSSNSLLDKVNVAYDYGEIYMKLGETQKAKEKLTFVAINGNKLYAARKAKEMLEELSKSENG